MFTMTPVSRAGFTYCLSAIALVALFAYSATQANAQEIVWPNTFNGQPEFSFNKKDISDEQSKLTVGRGKVTDTDPVTSLGVLIKRSVADPFASQQSESAPEINIQGPRLNDLLASAEVDLTEFKNFINALVERESSLDLSAHNFDDEVKRIVIQSLVSSPSAYVMINGQRYTEGDEFALQLVSKDESARIRSIIDMQIPDKSIVSDTILNEYIKLRDEALAGYKRRLREQSTFSGGHKISVVIKSIKYRELTVSILDKDYVLKLGTVL